MSIQIPITKQELRALRKILSKQAVVICVGDDAYVKTLLVAKDMLLRGHDGPIAKIKRQTEPSRGGSLK